MKRWEEATVEERREMLRLQREKDRQEQIHLCPDHAGRRTYIRGRDDGRRTCETCGETGYHVSIYKRGSGQ